MISTASVSWNRADFISEPLGSRAYNDCYGSIPHILDTAVSSLSNLLSNRSGLVLAAVLSLVPLTVGGEQSVLTQPPSFLMLWPLFGNVLAVCTDLNEPRTVENLFSIIRCWTVRISVKHNSVFFVRHAEESEKCLVHQDGLWKEEPAETSPAGR